MRKLRHEEIPRADPSEISALPKHPIHVVADNIRSIHNIGSIFRTSDAARIEELHLTGISGTPEHRGLHKAALGAQEVVPWQYHSDVNQVVESLREAQVRIAVLEITDAPTEIEDLTMDDFPLALILGNEISGVDDDLVREANFALEIPQYGFKQSLNVSVAYGVAVMSLVKHYRRLRGLPLHELPRTSC